MLHCTISEGAMGGIKGVLVDLDGVVYVRDETMPGALAAIERLRGAGLAVRFLTNTTRTPHRKILDRLRELGIRLESDDLMSPAKAARRMIEKEGLAPHLLVHPNLEEDFVGLQTGSRPAVVVGDAGEGFTYAALNAAYRVLDAGADGEAAFLALANNRVFRDRDGGLSMDAGPFVGALAYAARREPVVLGKPSPAFFLAALSSIGCTPEEAVMIGDDVEADVGGAMALGMAGVLVRTGKYEEGAEGRIDPRPTHVAADLAAAVDWILR
jgi:HAD superfamily hydrolase (TIGR01458 family)